MNVAQLKLATAASGPTTGAGFPRLNERGSIEAHQSGHLYGDGAGRFHV